MHSKLICLRLYFISQALFVMVISQMLFLNPAQGQISGISNETSGETINKLNQSNLNSYVSPKSLLASVFGEAQNNNTTTKHIINPNNLHSTKNLVGESATIILSNQIVPPKDYIHIYDSLPYKINSGHLTAKLPCDRSSKPALRIFTGMIPFLKPSTLQVIKELSNPGYMCLYYLDIPPKIDNEHVAEQNSTNIVSDIVLYNPTSVRQVLLNTSSIVIGISEISPANDLSPKSTITKS